MLSPWLPLLPPPQPPLAGEREVDVAVIGAGFAGLSCALALRRDGHSVALLEARHAGFGASGRNAGHVTPAIGKDLPSLLRLHGRVRARNAVLATNAYTPELGRLRSTATRLQVQLFRTEVLSPAQRARVGWHGREGLYTAHEELESYRLCADGRILGGAKIVRAGFGRRQLPDVDVQLAAELEAVFRARFPELRDLAIREHWGGPIFTALDFLPRVGHSGPHGNLLFALAWAGHGIPLASHAGEMIADLIAGREGPGAALWSRRGWPTPPEPLRWLAFRAIDAGLRWRDRASDREARGR